MKFYHKAIAAAALVVASAAPVLAGQVVASPGVSLTEAAAAKFNRDTRQDDRQVIGVVPGNSGPEARAQLAASAGLSAAEAKSWTLGEIFVAKINREARGDDRQAVKGAGVTVTTRSGSSADYSQLIASASLSADEAAGMTLTEIAAAKFSREGDEE